jgi:hypothetical protein
MTDEYCPEDGPAFTKLDCGHWADAWDVDMCGACREEAQLEASLEADKWARELEDDRAYERACDDRWERDDEARGDYERDAAIDAELEGL